MLGSRVRKLTSAPADCCSQSLPAKTGALVQSQDRALHSLCASIEDVAPFMIGQGNAQTQDQCSAAQR